MSRNMRETDRERQRLFTQSDIERHMHIVIKDVLQCELNVRLDFMTELNLLMGSVSDPAD